MIVKIYEFPHYSDIPIDRGYIESNEFSISMFWDMCNWHVRGLPKPENLHSDIEYCDHGIVFVNPETNIHYMALSIGWLQGTEQGIQNWVTQHKSEIFWMLSEEEIREGKDFVV